MGYLIIVGIRDHTTVPATVGGTTSGHIEVGSGR
jgi:hypothetical protein